MALRESFTELMKEAMKAGDKRRTGTLRMITAALKDRDIEARGRENLRHGPVVAEDVNQEGLSQVWPDTLVCEKVADIEEIARDRKSTRLNSSHT